MISERAWEILACPSCGGEIRREDARARCAACDTIYPAAGNGQLDLRLRGKKKYSLDIELGENLPPTDGVCDRLFADPSSQFDPTSAHLTRELTFGNRLTPELLSYFPRASSPGGFMLDLGCGDRDFAEICRQTNLEYVGMDYTGDAPDLLGDAHAQPFKDDVFDFILSVAVLEHLRYPLVATREAFRVLKPGGLFIGTVAFLEPFHMDSYYHHTHLGTLNSLVSAGFDVQHVAANRKWTGIRALANMSLFPRLPRFATDLIMLPVRILHRAWWKLGHLLQPKAHTSEDYRTIATTGGFRFIARKPAGIPVRTS